MYKIVSILAMLFIAYEVNADLIDACKSLNWNRFGQIATNSDSPNKSLLFGEITSSMQKYYSDNCSNLNKSGFPISAFHQNSEASCVSKCRTSSNNKLDDSPWLDFLIGSPYTTIAKSVGNKIKTISANDCKIACHALVEKAKGYFAGYVAASEKCKSAETASVKDSDTAHSE